MCDPPPKGKFCLKDYDDNGDERGSFANADKRSKVFIKRIERKTIDLKDLTIKFSIIINSNGMLSCLFCFVLDYNSR